jgi:serine/threonine protein kinase
MSFSLEPGVNITLNKSMYEVMGNPHWPKFAFAQEGRKSVVYKLKERIGQTYWALKIFKPAFCSDHIVANAISLKKYETVAGMQICRRSVIDGREGALNFEPKLKQAVLMPWVNGFSWSGIMMQKMAISRDSSLALANALSRLLALIEKHGEAHCDLAGENLIVDLELKQVELLDLEDMFSADMQQPQYIPAGGDGYQHHQSRQGLWIASADRFAGAVLLAELLTWHNPGIREMAYGEQFFDPAEMQQVRSARYRYLVQALADLSGNVAELFERAWNSLLLQECPKLWEWQQAIQQIDRKVDLASEISEFADSQVLTDLHCALDSRFDLEELRTLAFHLHVDYDNLRGEVKHAKARELVLYFERQNRLQELIEAVRRERGSIV